MHPNDDTRAESDCRHAFLLDVPEGEIARNAAIMPEAFAGSLIAGADVSCSSAIADLENCFTLLCGPVNRPEAALQRDFMKL